MNYYDKFNNLPIRKKLILISVSVSVVSLLLMCLTFIFYDQYSFKQFKKQEIKILADVISNRSAAAILFNDEDLAIKNLSSLEASKSVKIACIYINNKLLGDIRLFTSFKNKLHGDTACIDSEIIALMNSNEFIETRETISLLNPIVIDNEEIAYLYLNVSMHEAYVRFINYLLMTLIMMLTGITVCYLLMTKFEKYVTGGLLNLGKTLKTITGNKDFSMRAIKESHDEVGDVVDSFNEMLMRIEKENQNLIESEDKFKSLSEAATVGIFHLNENGKFLYCNKYFIDMTGATINQLINQGWLNSIYHEDYPDIIEKWRELVTSGEGFVFHCRFINKLESIVWASGQMNLLSNSNGDVLGYLGVITDVTELKESQLQLNRMRTHDSLTGLFNRYSFIDNLEKTILISKQTGNNAALFILNIDQFKKINDTIGYDTGDEVLKIIAHRITESTHSIGTAARFHGDEFTILLHTTTSTEANDFARLILDRIKEPVQLRGQKIRISASIGITIIPDNGTTANDLIKNTFIALYRAKELGSNNYQIFTPDMNTLLLQNNLTPIDKKK